MVLFTLINASLINVFSLMHTHHCVSALIGLQDLGVRLEQLVKDDLREGTHLQAAVGGCELLLQAVVCAYVMYVYSVIMV